MKTLTLILLAWFIDVAPAADAVDVDSFDWMSIEPSWSLNYTDCYELFRCARLKVPLDWLDLNNTNTVAIAIIKAPASVDESDPKHGGPILTNPGGPGDGGVSFLLGWENRLRPSFDSDEKKFDIIGFDPRGVGFTTPQADCFADPLGRQSYELQVRGIGALVPDAGPLSRRIAMSTAYGRLCGNDPLGEASILPYISTASVARDMVEMIDKIEELKQSKTKKAGPKDSLLQKPLGIDDQATSSKSVPRLQYVGFSYGTVLGNTFASMFPGRVGRIVLDGVADIDDYMENKWLKNLQDNQAIIDLFYRTCFESKSCPLKKESDRDWRSIQDRVDEFMTSLTLSPEPVLDGTSISYITANELKTLFFDTMYGPQQQFPRTADIIHEAMHGNFSRIDSFPEHFYPGMADLCPGPNNTDPLPPHHLADATADASTAILCGDGEPSTELTAADWGRYIETLGRQSPYVGPYWAEIRFSCANWRFRPKYRFGGPFETPEADAGIVEGRPAAPLLFVSSSLDPATPLRNAHAMAGRHPGAVVLEQDSAGHCAIGSVPCECTSRAVRAYFANGTMPEKGTVCHAECRPFHPCPGMETFGLGRGMVPPMLRPPRIQSIRKKMYSA